MHIVSESQIHNISLHKVGNKALEEGFSLSNSCLNTNDALNKILVEYFTKPFNSDVYFNFFHESELDLNEVFVYAKRIFDEPDSLFDQSVNIAKHLYEKSTHAKIKSGEFYTVYLSDCILDGETVDAVGLFKSENKDTFLKVFQSGQGFELETEQGVNIHKLDKGCIVFNSERENGFVVAVIDSTNRGGEAQYWVDDFLHLRQRQDEYFNTQNVFNLCKSFVSKEFPQQFDVSKADQVDFLNKSVKFFKENENFDMEEFTQEVIGQAEVIESFQRFKSDFQHQNEVEIADSFEISDSAVKKQARSIKSIIKLDKNFHIYVHGDRQLIEQGEDHKGKFYKVYFKEEH